jgi:integrase
MLTLPNNCRAGKISVFPKNWKAAKADIAVTWYVHYRFYDDNLQKNKKVVIKGMNRFTALSERRESVQTAIECEKEALLKGFNPILKKIITPAEETFDLDEVLPSTPFTTALTKTAKTITVADGTRDDIRYVLEKVCAAAKALGLNGPVENVKRKHIKACLDYCATHNPKWSANLHNSYLKYLSILFAALVENDACESNIIKDISRQKSVKKIRGTLTLEERKKVNDHLLNNYPVFYRFTQIFFHSGAREVELLALRGGDVDLVRQRYKVVIRKGKDYREEWKPIKDIALEFWRQQMAFCGPADYVFSEDLEPGEKAIRHEQIPRRWLRLVKNKLGITADFYSLKHTNLDETAAQLNIEEAAKMASHTSTVITMDYATGERDRQHARLKKVANSFAG